VPPLTPLPKHRDMLLLSNLKLRGEDVASQGRHKIKEMTRMLSLYPLKNTKLDMSHGPVQLQHLAFIPCHDAHCFRQFTFQYKMRFSSYLSVMTTSG
jgi:hypothetical protein